MTAGDYLSNLVNFKSRIRVQINCLPTSSVLVVLMVDVNPGLVENFDGFQFPSINISIQRKHTGGPLNRRVTSVVSFVKHFLKRIEIIKIQNGNGQNISGVRERLVKTKLDHRQRRI